MLWRLSSIFSPEKPSFMWSSLGKGELKLFRGGSRVSDEGVQMAKGGFVLVLLPKFS